MRGKIFLIIGFSAGYVLGAKAGRKRYEQIRKVSSKVWNSPPVQNVAEEVNTLVGKVTPTVMEKIGQGSKYIVSVIAGIPQDTEEKSSTKSSTTKKSSQSTKDSEGSTD